MSAVATTTTDREAETDEGQAMIDRARAIQRSGRLMTQAEAERAKADQYWAKLGKGGWNPMDLAAYNVLRGIYDELARRAAAHSAEEIRQMGAAALTKIDAHLAKRPERWAALSPLRRAVFLLESEIGTPPDLARLLHRLIMLSEQATATKQPPRSFEAT